MEDKELFDFFKSRSQAFNQAPGNALWAKIEAQMPLAPAKPLNGKTKLFTRGLLLFIIATVVSGVVFFMLPQKKAPDNIIHKEVITAPKEVVYKNDTVKKKMPQKQVIKFAPKKVEKARTAVAGIASNAAEEGIISPPITNNPKVINGIIEMVNPKKVEIDTIKFDLNTIKMTTQTPPGRVIVSVKQKLLESQFMLLTEKLVADHKDEYGTLVVVKAPGHKLFRQIIKNTEVNVQPMQVAIDSVKRIQPIKISFQDSILNVKPEIKAGTISFKRDTLKQATTRPAKAKNRKNKSKVIKNKKATETEELLDI